MNTWNDNLLILARGGQELSWRYAWAMILVLLTTQQTFPLPLAVGAIILGASISKLAAGRSWRIYQVILLQTAGFVLIGLMTLYWTQYRNFSFLNVTWLSHLFLGSKTFFEWLLVLLYLFCLWLFWHAGQILVRGSRKYLPVCLQFDKGLGLFILLLVVLALIDRRTEINLYNQVTRYMILAFFIFSLVAIALSRNRGQVQKSFIFGYHGLGVILSALSIIGLFGAGTTLLAYPYLYRKADSFLLILKDVAEPMKPLFLKIIYFLFQPRQIKLYSNIQDENIPSIEEMGAPVVEGWQALLLKTTSLGTISLIALVALGVLCYLIYRLVRWLLRKNSPEPVPQHLATLIKRILNACQAILLWSWAQVINLVKGVDSAASVYFRMLRWGRYSGLVSIPSETPIEYGNRLMRYFPDLQTEIILIVGAFNQEVYGQVAGSKKNLSRLVSAHRRMTRLRHWPSRFRTWFRQ
jgi:uncharacterized protein DUF4129